MARTSFPARSWTRADCASLSPTSKNPRRSIRPSPATPPTTSRESSSYKLPITPPPLQNHGNYVVSLNKLVKWLGGLVEKKGVNLFTQFAGRELLYEKNGIAGVLTEDKGVDKNGKPKDNFTPGYELRAKVTVLAEGPRGSLTKELVNKLKLDGLNPQVYGTGHQGIVGRAAGAHRHRVCGAHAGLAAQFGPLRRRLGLRPAE